MQVNEEDLSDIFMHHNDPEFSYRQVVADSADTDQTAPRGSSLSAILAAACKSFEGITCTSGKNP